MREQATKLPIRLGLAALCALLLAACGADSGESGGQNPTAQSEAGQSSGEQAADLMGFDQAGLDGRWVLQELDGEPILESLQGSAYVEFMEERKVVAYSGINRYMVEAEGNLAQGEIGFKMGLGTMVAGPPKAMEFERAFLTVLSQVSSFSVSGTELDLSTGAGSSLALTAAPEQDE